MSLTIVSRAEWGARPWTDRRGFTPSDADGIVLHHSVTTPTSDPAADLLAIQRFHQNDRGWFDIAYSWLIHPTTSYAYEGRGLTNRQGATSPVNSRYYAVCFIGNYENDLLTPAMIDTFRALRARLVDSGAGQQVRIHSEFSATACPGKNTRSGLVRLRNEVDGWAGLHSTNV